MIKRPSVGMVVGLSIVGGFALGIGTLSGLESDEFTAESISGASDAELAVMPGSATEFPEVIDDPETAVYEPFMACSADYANGPGAALDQRNLMGPENSVLVSPEQMRAMGRSAAEIESQTRAWNELSPESREEQLCRAAQQNAAIAEPRPAPGTGK
ncbi:hypothetical protein H9638_02300 [Arthrobacter sp. Sa2BUA2]|uniref:Uncharacterized protein n=1 Tax=Arthrobacter pullicola TaxID=2762224 RepID=A0ABR8YEI4_9MICC|nr:hypothetical protein [Arthrobacter pullicola]MBD8042636.1 hypothetical protein [Arthrobacter pullicola]